MAYKTGLLSHFDWKNSLIAAFVAIAFATASGLLFADEYVSGKIDEKAYSRSDGRALERAVEIETLHNRRHLEIIRGDIAEMRQDLKQVLRDLNEMNRRIP